MEARDELFDRAVNEACRYLDATGYWSNARAALTHWTTRVRYVARLDSESLIEACLSRSGGPLGRRSGIAGPATEGSGQVWRGGPAGAWVKE